DEDGSVAAIIDAARLRRLDGLIGGGGPATGSAARAGEALGLAFPPAGAAAIARAKHPRRAQLRAAGLPVPWFLPSQIDANPRELAKSLTFPCVVKPVALSGSRGGMGAEGGHEFL